MKFVVGIMVFIGVIIILGGLPALMNGIKDFRTDTITDEFIVSTGVGVSTGSVQLTDTLWDGETANAEVASNLTVDTPVMVDYTVGNRSLNLSGLGANTSRLITVEYKTAGLTGYTGADTGVKSFPVVFVLGLIGICCAAVIYVLLGR